MSRRYSLCMVLIVGLVGVANGQVEMRPKVSENDGWTSNVTSEIHQVMTIRDMQIETKVKQVIQASAVSGKRAANGTIAVKNKVDRLMVNLQLPGGIELTFDSKKKVEPHGTAADFLLDVLKATAAVQSTMVYGKDGRVKSAKVKADEVDNLEESSKVYIKDQLDEQYLAKAVNQELDRLPQKAVRPGDTWKSSSDVRIGAGQTFGFKTKYKYEGTVKHKGQSLDRISFTLTDVTYSVEKNDVTPVEVTGSKLKCDGSKGVLLFDRKKGRIVDVKQSIQIKGKLTLKIADMEQPADLDLKINTQTTVK